MKSLMNAKIRMTMEICPRKKAQRAFMALYLSFPKRRRSILEMTWLFNVVLCIKRKFLRFQK
jgi:hypothetical protein